MRPFRDFDDSRFVAACKQMKDEATLPDAIGLLDQLGVRCVASGDLGEWIEHDGSPGTATGGIIADPLDTANGQP